MGQLVIPGVLLSPAKRLANPAGDVVTFIKEGDSGLAGIGEVYGSFIKQGARKGWRKHNVVTLNIVVPVGKIRFVLYDYSQKLFEEITLGYHNYQRLTIPPGVWMAFEGIAEGESLLLNAIDQPHDPAEADTQDLSAIYYAW